LYLGQRGRLILGPAVSVLAAIGLLSIAIFGFPSYAGSVNQVRVQPVVQCGFVTQCTAVNPSGLLVSLTITNTTVKSSGYFEIGISGYNPTSHYINMSAESKWYIPSQPYGGPCSQGRTPFGVDILRGYYSISNVSEGKNVLSFPPALVFCATGIENDTTPSIPALSYVPVPVVSLSCIYAIAGDNVTSGDVCGNGFLVSGGNFVAFVSSIGSRQPSVYTLVGVDEWGDLVILHFSVFSGNSTA
jgi:hypothetical protein